MIVSACCGEPVYVDSGVLSPDSHWYACSKCKEPCETLDIPHPGEDEATHGL